MTATGTRPLGERTVAAAWGPDVAIGGVVLVLGLLFTPLGDGVNLVLVVSVAVAAGLFRRAPGAALALVWVGCLLQVATGTPPLLVQVGLLVVSYGCARWGSPATVALSGLSIPASLFLAAGLVTLGLYVPFADVDALRRVLGPVLGFGYATTLVALVVALLVLGAPWLAGLTLRSVERARRSRAQQEVAEEDAAQAASARDQAEEIARLRADQARLAGDVHDVVGHSLAVILAQAESGQYLPDDDPARLKQTLATIATSARTSLQDVREVLATTRGEPTTASGPGELDELVEGVRRSGHHVESSVVGRAQPLPPDLAEVAYRVLQEMLTNAIRHGVRETPVVVERHWEGELRMEVVNSVPVVDDDTLPIAAVGATSPAGSGQGLPGMRRRLESVGGRLDVRRRGDTFTATAWVPVRR